MVGLAGYDLLTAVRAIVAQRQGTTLVVPSAASMGMRFWPLSGVTLKA